MSDFNISEIIGAIRDQSHVFRYNRLRVHRKQSDAEHVGRACQLALLFVSDLRVRYCVRHNDTPWNSIEFWRTLSQAVLSGITIHDMGESKFGDVTWDIKQLFPQIDSAESTYLHQLWDGILPSNPPIPGCIELISAADCAEGILYCIDEMDLGNTTLNIVLGRYADRLKTERQALISIFGVSPISIDYLLTEARSRQ